MFDAQHGPEDDYFTYANINYGIIGTLVEIISGVRFDIYCRENIFNPLGITGSFNVYDLPDINNLAVLYRKNGNNSYGIFNTYALGNHTTVDLLAGEELIGHPGEAYGLISDMYFSKAGDYGIIFITNGGVFSFGDTGWYSIEEDVFETCFQQLIQETKSSLLLDKKKGIEILEGVLNLPVSEERNTTFRLTIYDLSGRTVIDHIIPPNQDAYKLSELRKNQLYLILLDNMNSEDYYTAKYLFLN